MAPPARRRAQTSRGPTLEEKQMIQTVQSPWDYDVIQAGCGPVSQTMAGLLGQLGHRVGVFEQWPEVYPLPRAGHIDHEIMRILQNLGLARSFEPMAVPLRRYDWMNGAGELLLRIGTNETAVSGWQHDYLMFQPELQDLLLAHLDGLESVDVHFGSRVTGVRDLGDHVEVDVERGVFEGGQWRADGPARTATALFALGADGANSIVREAAGVDWVDLGFEQPWLVVDVEPNDPGLVIDMPTAAQLCDPDRPISMFRWLGRRHCRWEFMLLPGETAGQISAEAEVWRLLSRWNVTSAQGRIIRRAVYTFRSLLADRFSFGRVTVMGDAAHLMPPFLGQGMCSGMRDAANLAWKLDLVLRGLAELSLIDTYTAERRPHVETIVRMSIELGHVVCVADPEFAALRDAEFKAGRVPPPPAFPWLTDGIIHRTAGAPETQAGGRLARQPRVHLNGRTGLLDDVVGGGWRLITALPPEMLALSEKHSACLESLGTKIVQITTAAVSGAAIDVDGDAAEWFEELDADAVLVRPDHYIFGAARAGGLNDLIRALSRQLEPHMTQALA